MISKKLSIVHCQLSIILAFLPLSVAYAQQDSTLNRTVVVENEYNPNIMDASKINVLPKVEEPAVMKKGIEYATALRPVLAWLVLFDDGRRRRVAKTKIFHKDVIAYILQAVFRGHFCARVPAANNACQ